ncbi:Large ribosomal subunit protein bL17m [Caenorhabditis elegans]|uniref:Large ribosomal subunit protein bL17m n=1 Tax=Caenorhabditis elegans TaxID=6239 RepID=Q9N3F3_CAEEL|nr:Large ribosomal subunit protein bL17m [Caenorhabditis elegans]CCD72825.1 Large ribosomal subunit protein bL17m [Caenorhabditis elegans]|eukprot:NP_491114.2 Mitochondrial Ribosomal Protein, Large [Caenorhabditis elegans]
MSAHRVAVSLPRIGVTIGHAPQKLKTGGIEPSRRARLEVLRRIVTRTVREERAELKWNRAVEARPYLERLIQLGVERGPLDEYTAEMMEWWLPEKDLITKMHEVIVPRFQDRDSPFTSLFRLPPQRLQQFIQNKREVWKRYDIGVLEIDGNPFPQIQADRVDQSESILDVLLADALRNHQKNLQEKLDTPKKSQ